MFKIEFFKDNQLYNSVVIYRNDRVYELMYGGYGSYPFAIYVNEIGIDYIIYQETSFNDEEAIGEKVRLNLNRRNLFNVYSPKSSSYKPSNMYEIKLCPFNYPNDLKSFINYEDIALIEDLLIDGIGNKKEREEMINYLYDKKEYSFLLDIYRNGLYGFDVDENKVKKIMENFKDKN